MWCSTTATTWSAGADPEHLAAQREFAAEVERAALGRLDQVGQGVFGAVRDSERGLGLGRRDDPLIRLPVLLEEHGAQRLVPAATSRSAARSASRSRSPRSRKTSGKLYATPLPVIRSTSHRRRWAADSGMRSGRSTTGATAGRAGRPPSARAASSSGVGRLEEVADRQFGAQLGAGPADQPGGEQGVAAEVEEAVLGADFGQAEHLGEEPAEHLLLGSARPSSGAERDGRFGLGQGAHVELAVVVHGQPVEGDEGGRDHVVGQPLLEVLAELPDQAVRVARGGRRRWRTGLSPPPGRYRPAVSPGASPAVAAVTGQEHGVVRARFAGPRGQHAVTALGTEVVQRLRVHSPVGSDTGVGDTGETQRGRGDELRRVEVPGEVDGRDVVEPQGGIARVQNGVVTVAASARCGGGRASYGGRLRGRGW